jgi:ligand-binding sensor domain-containing protein/signal transduction histidine kinase
MYRRYLIIAFVLSVLLLSPAQAFPGGYRFAHLGVQDGLSHGAVKAIIQDQQGFIWIGTSNGLNRFDGVDVIAHFAGDGPGQLDSDYIRDLMIASDGTLWVGTANGLSSYDSLSGKFRNYPLPVSGSGEPTQAYRLASAANGDLWVATGGLGLARFSPEQGDYHFIRHQADRPKAGPSSDFIYTVLPGIDGTLWLGHRDHGLDHFDPANGLLRNWRHQAGQSDSLSHNLVYDILLSSDEQLWIATRGGGINRLHEDSGGFDRFQADGNDPYSLADDRVWGLIEDQQRRIWAVTQAGVSRIKQDHAGFDNLSNNPLDPTSLASDTINAVVEDQHGKIWFGTFGSGVSWMDPTTERFGRARQDVNEPTSLPVDHIASMYASADSLWLGTTNGLLRRRFAVPGYQHFAEQTSLASTFVRAILANDDGSVWVGTEDQGLFLVDSESGTSQRFLTPSVSPSGESSGARSIHRIARSHDGKLWVSSRDGLYLMQAERKATRLFQHEPDNPASLPATRITTLLADEQGRLWVGTTAGLAVLHDAEAGEFRRFQSDPNDTAGLSNNTVSVLHLSGNSLWIGTFGGGLNRLDLTTWEITPVSKASGLSATSIQSIEEDTNGMLWLGSATGLFRFNPADNSAIRFGLSDGLQSNHFEHHASTRDASGRLYFGGAAGYNQFLPEQVVISQRPPPTVITQLQVFPESHTLTELGQGIAPDRIRLSSDQRVLSAQFAALSYTGANDHRYRYRLLGLEEDWQFADALRNRVTWSYLPSGEFEFVVQASGQAGNWGAPDRLRISKAAPFWQSPPAYLLYLAVLAGIITGLFLQSKRNRLRERRRRVELKREVRARTRALRQRNRQLKLAQNQLMTQEKMASLGSLVAGVSHEINTPLGIGVTAASQLQNALKRFQRLRESSDLKVRDLTAFEDTVAEGSDIILRNLKRATELMRSFKQVAVDQTGEQYRSFDLRQYIDETLAALGPKLRQAQTSVSVECPPGIHMKGYPGAIYQILANLTLNSLIHGFEDGEASAQRKIDIRARTLANHRVELLYSDNGRGMDQATLRKVFDPFFTTRMGEGGSGLGMHIVYNLCTQLLGGSIEASSDPGRGLKVTIVLPMEVDGDKTATEQQNLQAGN